MSNRYFDLNQDKNRDEKVANSLDPKQMDFNDFLFHLPEVEFTEAKEGNSNDLIPSLTYSEDPIFETNSGPTKRYFGLSFALHAALASALVFLTVPLIKDPPKELITIEIQDTQGSSSKEPMASALLPVAPPEAVAPKEEKIKASAKPTTLEKIEVKKAPSPIPVQAEKATVEKAPEVEELTPNEPVIKLQPISTAKSKAAPKPKAVAPAPIKQNLKPTAPTEKVALKNLVQESEVAVPATLDDIKSEDLDTSAVATVAKAPSKDLNKDIDNDFNKLDQDSHSQIEKESQDLGALAKNLEMETDENLKSAEAENKAQMAAALEANKDRRNKEAQAIAAAQAQEAAESAAQAQAAAAAAAKADADRAAKTKALADSEAAEGNGAAADASAGDPGNGTVRSLQEMRQMPGNPKPYYDNDERLRGDAGEIVFLAYVTKDGRTTNFKLVKGTGHRNLDLKTLKALKKWKFYPGQEGWVEFPFQWSLNGGVKEMPALLRRSR